MEALLQLKGIDKAFPGVKALSGAALNVYPGRVMALVGENGPELVNLRGGEHIYTNGQTRSLLGGDSISIGQITIDAKNVKEFNDIVNIARNEAVSMRQGVTT